MGKQTIQEIAKILVEKNKLTPKEASLFAASMFELIQQRLDKEELVKIKGLGTFKMIRVEARESVSVRTGERVMIDSHAKITFTPDTMMKELVNKPFSQFETVILNDGVEFEDLADDLTDEEQMELDRENEESTTIQPLLNVVEDHPAVEEEKVTLAEEPLQEDSQTEETQMEEPQTEEPQQEELLSFYEEEEESSSWKKTLGYGLLTLLLMAASAYGGYWYGQRMANAVVEEPVTETPEVIAIDSIPDLTNDTIAIVEETVTEQPVAEQPKPEVKQEQKPEEEPFWKKYEAMDVRVKTGAYHIVGTDHEVTARKGETLSRIARRELGEGMSCYIEVYNNLKPNTPLQEGQIIKIPKLKWKKNRTNN